MSSARLAWHPQRSWFKACCVIRGTSYILLQLFFWRVANKKHNQHISYIIIYIYIISYIYICIISYIYIHIHTLYIIIYDMYFILVPSIHLVVSLPSPFGGAVAASRHVVPPGGEENSRGESAGRRSPELGVGLGMCIPLRIRGLSIYII